MIRWFREIDELLRGRKTSAETLATGTRQLSLGAFSAASVVLGAVYGVCMGLYSVIGRETPEYRQLLATTVKVPLLFLLTLVVTFPSLYVFGALLGTRLKPLDMLRVIVAAIAVNVAVLASLGPITAFFTLSTESYHFMKLLNVGFFALAGLVGLGFLLSVLHRLEEACSEPVEVDALEGDSDRAQTLERLRRAHGPVQGTDMARRLFRVWLLVYALVGAQMAWVLRPFIGSPELGFAWWRQRGGNFFLDVWQAIGRMVGS